MLPQEYSLIVTADHGGHDQNHGTECPEDMTIPMIFWGEPFQAGVQAQGLTILDIAPTVASLLELHPLTEWEGKTLLR